jgi:deoxyribonuclease-4
MKKNSNNLAIGCHVSAAGGVWNAPQNARELECETFQIFTRSPQGGKAPELTPDVVDQFKEGMTKFGFDSFVVHCPYFVNFGSAEPRIYHGSSAVVKQELDRSSLLGASLMMTHLGTFTVTGQELAFKQTKEGLTKVLTEYEGTTKFLLEISAGSGGNIGDTFEELAELMEPLVKFKTFGGICFDTQHAFSAGYDLRTSEAVEDTFKKFDKVIGLEWLKMSHINDSKIELGGHKDRHEHIGEGLIGEDGFKALLSYFNDLSTRGGSLLSSKGETKNGASGAMPLILETKHDKVESDIKILKSLRDKISKK